MSQALRHAENASVILDEVGSNSPWTDASDTHESKVEMAKAQALASIALSLASIDGAITNTAGPSGRLMIEVSQ